MAAVTMNIEKARFNMIEQQIRPWNVLDPSVLSLLSVVKREDFVPAAHKDLAFADIEIPIGAKGNASQTMLAPKIEARMLQELAIRNTDKVLEIGTGTGYMAALLAAKAEYVYSVEIDPGLAEIARNNLQQAGVANVSVEIGDGVQGRSSDAPYDVIVLSGSLPVLPERLLNQLKIGGRLAAVVGEAPVMQLQVITRTSEDAFSTNPIFETVVAPLTNAAQSNKFVF
ncbi:Protein-L-isoaspartate O-methyltransferase [Candidatus Propionivibrio aalborgensis]|uniref:Protein-L-isoaspartate O-methyltransferase n=2 Tax=Candidatus Propionivibrio aalborgensis TaxID=1860101 RepID=A0A1A8XZT1_9RHOO|nr:Protein-L-isoaspartate O-methyltransferase [Candidatus Propionivibrio aalborgensis]